MRLFYDGEHGGTGERAALGRVCGDGVTGEVSQDSSHFSVLAARFVFSSRFEVRGSGFGVRIVLNRTSAPAAGTQNPELNTNRAWSTENRELPLPPCPRAVQSWHLGQKNVERPA